MGKSVANLSQWKHEHRTQKERLRERLRGVAAVDYLNSVVVGIDLHAEKQAKRLFEDIVCALAGWDEDDRTAAAEELDRAWERLRDALQGLLVDPCPHRIRASMFMVSKFIPELKSVEVVNMKPGDTRDQLNEELRELGLDPEQVWAQLPSK